MHQVCVVLTATVTVAEGAAVVFVAVDHVRCGANCSSSLRSLRARASA